MRLPVVIKGAFMKKLIPLFIAASLLMCGCQGGNGDVRQDSDPSSSSVTTSVSGISDQTTEDIINITEATSSDIGTTGNKSENASVKNDSDTVRTTEVTKGKDNMKETYTTPVTEIVEFSEEDVITSSNGAKANPDGSIDLPIIPVR